jgi:hypothetical protein
MPPDLSLSCHRRLARSRVAPDEGKRAPYRDDLLTGRADETPEEVHAPASRDCPVSDVDLTESLRVGISRDTRPDLAPCGEHAEFISDDGTLGGGREAG